MTIDQISVFVENKPGRLVEVIEALGAKGIDMRAMSIADTSDFGILRLIVDKPQEALAVLRDADCVTSVTQVIAVAVSDTPGSLAKILRLLSDAGISIEYVYAFITHEKGGAYVIVRVEDNDKAIGVLTKSGVRLLSSGELYDM
ncbi:ACT domain protein [Sporobacter termitidis DSM 10068]|uniref:ACT domain protein n=1 Tax=Sporobacter termitidis DSM 10068 TaxID=1123282 RepID=A0A1M5TRW5_9FIRM|nr:ACT domain-containing protein [Sporobacter termitidis]SHH53512.1 ACT domain protein [Sporobacter termitidis DSM 10068]